MKRCGMTLVEMLVALAAT
ncbi:MAG: prepilin-type N-terminal cleavage/methylation domain-containing protein, partial [Planctomycetia bacterium]|nr:prepilin-type N-terminal cleavage/methylation domain-containing protein [Planctomycetia bacterium]